MSYIKKCPECSGINLFYNKEKGEVICKDCGLVLEDKMVDFTQEWREFDSDSASKRRTGAPMTYTIHDKGLSTMIDWRNRDSYGKHLAPGKRAQIYRLRKWQRRIRVSDATERPCRTTPCRSRRRVSASARQRPGTSRL